MVLVGIFHIAQGIGFNFPRGGFLGFFIGWQTRFANIFLYGKQAGEGHFQPFHILRHFHIHHNGIVFDTFYLFHIADAGNAQLLGNLRAYLSRVSICGLQTADNQVKVPKALDSLGQGIAGGQHIGTTKLSVRNQSALIGPHGKGFIENLLRRRRPHGQHV